MNMNLNYPTVTCSECTVSGKGGNHRCIKLTVNLRHILKVKKCIFHNAKYVKTCNVEFKLFIAV